MVQDIPDILREAHIASSFKLYYSLNYKFASECLSFSLNPGAGTEKMVITGTPTKEMVKLEFTYTPKGSQGNAKQVAFFYFNSKDGEYFLNTGQ